MDRVPAATSIQLRYGECKRNTYGMAPFAQERIFPARFPVQFSLSTPGTDLIA